MPDRSSIASHDVQVEVGEISLPGRLALPPNPRGIVVFAHGSGSSRHSARNRFVADVIHQAGEATLLFDLLTAEEHRVDEQTHHLRFDIHLLAERLIGTIDWLREQEAGAALPVGLFGASTGAAAALIAAARRPEKVAAVVSRGGRPDLAGPALSQVAAPSLLIVGERDTQVLALNRVAASQLTSCEHRLTIVTGATHLFEEPGTLEEAANLTQQWFRDHLGRARRAA